MTASREIKAAAAWLLDEAEKVKSAGGVDVPAGEASYARQRIRALSAGLLAGLHLGDCSEGVTGG